MIYEYVLTDHLGNTRITFGDADADGQPDILQENHYYPFGMAMTMSSTLSAAPPNNYLYNGKELQPETGWLDYGARMYDASVG
ncbi:MAG: RHS repeat-associated core domain-containing protein, partial [Bacteroidia bacterium]|nr:RHS repeat-associated core domain-containing protein [Bacteroidia bacterium]